MNYDDINNYVEKRPWVVMVTAVIVVSLCLVILFMNYSNKQDIDKAKLVTAAWKGTVPQKVMVKKHQGLQKKMAALVPTLMKPLTLIQCPRHLHDHLPLCARCNVPLEPVANQKTLFRCPVCGQERVAPCPTCSQPMQIKSVHRVGLATGADETRSGYICTVCRRQLTPNFDRHGVPRCPYDNNVMTIQQKEMTW